MSAIKPYLQLVRLPNLFTAMTDVLAGYWLVYGLSGSATLACLLVATACLYAAGIVYNDLADVQRDRKERPHRPLPSGRVGEYDAILIALGLSVVGLLAATLAGFLSAEAEGWRRWVPGLVAVVLLAAIVSYDFRTKGTALGPLNMGACRGLNLLMAMSVGWTTGFLLGGIAIGAMVLYITSLTYFGATEASQTGRGRLVTGMIGIGLALLMLGVLVAGRLAEPGSTFLTVLWLATFVHLMRMAYRAVRNPCREQVQFAMKSLILGIIAIDAILATCGGGWQGGVIVLAFLAPTLLIGRWIYST